MTLSQNSLNNAARWSVMWLGKRGIVEKKFDTDFAGALEAYVLLRRANKKLVTLRSCNIGFSPPDHITHHKYVTYEVVRRKGKRYKRKVVREKDLMSEYNDEGTWWCPYCVRLRPFKAWKDWAGQQHMRCPVCHITERDWYVRRWNPKAKVIEFRRKRRGSRRVRGSSRKR